MPVFSIALHTCRLALRARFTLLILLFLFFMCVVAWMGAQFSGRQPSTVALDLGISVIRALLPFFSVFMLQDLILREYERRYYLVSHSYPFSRTCFLLGRVLGILLMLFFALVVLGGGLAILVRILAEGYSQSRPVSLGWEYMLCLAFVFVDLLVITAVGVLLSVIASSSSFLFIGTLGFMLIARSFATVMALLETDAWLVNDSEVYQGGVGLLRYFLPDLGALDIRMVPIYDSLLILPADWFVTLLSCVFYAVAFLAVALSLLNSKRFS